MRLYNTERVPDHSTARNRCNACSFLSLCTKTADHSAGGNKGVTMLPTTDRVFQLYKPQAQPDANKSANFRLLLTRRQRPPTANHWLTSLNPNCNGHDVKSQESPKDSLLFMTRCRFRSNCVARSCYRSYCFVTLLVYWTCGC